MYTKLLLNAFSIAVAGMIVMPKFADAQCAYHGCQGRCQYCVDGQCYPNRETFGFYETRWRRWPVETPPIVTLPKGPQAVDPSLGPAAEVPTPSAEGEANPEFPHLRKRQGSASGTPMAPGAESLLPTEAPDPFGDDTGLMKHLHENPVELSPQAHYQRRNVVPADYSQTGRQGTVRPANLYQGNPVRGQPAGSQFANPLRLGPARIAPRTVPISAQTVAAPDHNPHLKPSFNPLRP